MARATKKGAPKKFHEALPPEEIDEITEELVVTKARIADLSARLRSHVRATGEPIDCNGVRVSKRQSEYQVLNPLLAARGLMDFLFPDEDLRRALPERLFEIRESITLQFRNLFMALLAKSQNKVIRGLPGQKEIQAQLESDSSSGGLVIRRGDAKMDVRYTELNPLTTQELGMDEMDLLKFEGEIEPEGLDREREGSAWDDGELKPADLDADELEAMGFMDRDYRERD